MQYSSLTLVILIIVTIYSLFYTFKNDYGMFLLIILLLLASLYGYLYFEEQYSYYQSIIKSYEQKFDNSILNFVNTLDNIKKSLLNN
jgi:hypothetical protein